MEDNNKGEGENFTIWKAFNCYEVQRTVAHYLSVKDLMSLRLLNKYWAESALIFLKESSQVVLNSKLSFENYISFLQSSPICFANYQIKIKQNSFDDKAQVVELFRQFWNLCYDSVVDISIFIPWTCAYPLLQCMFLEKRGCRLERLSLQLGDVDNDDKNDNWAEESSETATEGSDDDTQTSPQVDSSVTCGPVSLTSLTLNVSIVLNAEKKVFPFTWAEFFQICPNVCHLSIQSDYASGHFYRIFKALIERKSILKAIKIGTRDQRLFSDDFLRHLCLLTSSSTTTLSLGFLPLISHDSALDSMLAQTSASLRHLTFLQIRTSNQANLKTFSSSGRQLPNLTTLRLTKELLPNLNVLVKMPRIKRLEIFRESTIGQHDTLSNPVVKTRSLAVIDSLQSLVIEPFVPDEHVWKLARWFPNLKRLQLKANDVIARIVFMSWPNLKELCLVSEITRDSNDIVRSSLTDEGITGLTREFLQKQDVSSFAQQGGGSCGDNAIPERNVAYIGDLRKLEMCKLQAVPDYQTGLTDFSIYFGIMKAPALNSITLVKTLVSPVAADHLRARGVSVTLSKN